MATAAMSVDRHDRMKSSTMMLARMLPEIRCPSNLVQGRQDVPRLVLNDSTCDVVGQAASRDRGSRSLTASITSTVFSPDCRCTCSTTAGLPSSRASVRTSLVASPTSPRSRSRTGVPPTVATTRSGKSRACAHAAQRPQAQLADALRRRGRRELRHSAGPARRGPAGSTADRPPAGGRRCSTCTARSAAPAIVTWPTPGADSMTFFT